MKLFHWKYLLSFFVFGICLCASSRVQAETTDNISEKDFCPKFSSYEGLLIHNIIFESLLNLNYEELLSSIVLRKGEHFTCSGLKNSLDGLYLRKIFQDIAVDIKETADKQLVVRFLLESQLVLSKLSFDGNRKVSQKKIERWASLRLGHPFSFEGLEEALKRIKSYYAKEGLYQVHVDWEYENFRDPYVAVVCRINEGAQAYIKQLEFEGELPAEWTDIKENILDYAIDKKASEKMFRQLRGKILAYLRLAGYLQASVEMLQSHYDSESNEVALKFRITSRRPIEIKFIGNEQFSDAELMKLLELEKRSVPFGVGAIKSFAENIERLYQASGYYFAKVDLEDKSEETDKKVFQINISESRRYSLRAIEFEGVQSISESELRDVIKTKEKGWFFLNRFSSGIVIREQLNEDVLAIEGLYKRQGFLNTKVRKKVRGSKETGEIKLTFIVNEDRRHLIEQVNVIWKDKICSVENENNKTCPNVTVMLKTGEPFNLDIIESERERLFLSLIEQGYPNADVSVLLNEDKNSVEFDLSSGQLFQISNIVLQGNNYTHDNIIKRELGFKEGGLFNTAEMEKSRQNLYSLGFFREVSIEPLDKKLDEVSEDVAVRVVEKDTAGVDFGIGWTTEDGINLSSDVSQKNLYGEGDSLIGGIDGYFKTGQNVFDAGTMRASWIHPRLFETKSDLVVELFAVSSVELIEEYSFDRYGSNYGLRFPIAEDIKSELKYSLYEERLFDVEDGVAIGDKDIGSHTYGMLKGDVEWDRRDDPYNPQKGGVSSWKTLLASSVIGSSSDFIGGTLKESYYLPLTKRTVWVNSASGTIIDPYGSSTYVPLGSRLFLGGRNSLRGYSFNSIAPRADTKEVVGGDSSAVFTSELRYRLTDNMQGLVFLDAGQAFLLNKESFEGDANNLGDIRYSPGFGIHYDTPIGPIRAEIGFATKREFGERWGRFIIAVGSTL